MITNPPFSLFREYVAQLVANRKKFVILGHISAVTYKEIFPLIKEDKMWLGCSTFNLPTGGSQQFSNVRWYTNIPPRDYPGVMGVPITFLDKYNPALFEIVKLLDGDKKVGRIDGQRKYTRLLIRRR